MWRTLRQVFSKRSGNPANLRLGQVQVSEKNDDGHALPSHELDVHRHGKVVRLIDHDLSRAEIEDGFNLVRSFLLHADQKQQKKISKITSFIGGGREEEESNCGSFLDEFKLWCSGVVALSSILSCRKFIYDQDNNIDFRRIPQALYFIAIHNPRSALAVLPVVQQETSLSDSESRIDADSLSNAASSFATASNECTAACQNKLGVKYASQKQYQKAFTLFQQASEQGHSVAQFNLGLCFENGKGTDKDLFKAAECYEKACALNHPGALYNLALFYIEGIGGIPKDHHKGLELLEIAAQGGLGKAQSYLGIHYAHKSSKDADYSKAISYLEQAVLKKDKEAEYNLGICYERGLGVERNMVMAGQMYKAAAKHGHTSAQFNVGVFYEHGLGDFPVDHKEALRYYRMAAENGDQDAQHNYLVLNQQVSASPAGYDVLWTIFKQMIVNNKGAAEKSMARCSSSPDINEYSKATRCDSGQSLVAI